jgi:1-pyrroline-5-carboxylate dehydrogenase
MKLFEAAGMPAGVINFLPGRGSEVGDIVLADPNLAGIHFTGSTEVFQHMWKTVGENIKHYKTYPRIVGETGGKDFAVVHGSADVDEVTTAIIRGAFEYQGQKCSALSRAYIPESLWDKINEKLLAQLKTVKMGSPEDFNNFMNAVIDKAAFKSITEYIEYAKLSKDAKIIYGGNYDDSKGYFIEPTVILTIDPRFKTMKEEIFGPVITIYVYQDRRFDEILELCDTTSPYALTGAIFAKDREIIIKAAKVLEHAAGNFYINDKPTGAVVGQQPFGGSRASGTNDKAGSAMNLLRWMSVRSVKENFEPPKDYRYPFMEEK